MGSLSKEASQFFVVGDRILEMTEDVGADPPPVHVLLDSFGQQSGDALVRLSGKRLALLPGLLVDS